MKNGIEINFNVQEKNEEKKATWTEEILKILRLQVS